MKNQTLFISLCLMILLTFFGREALANYSFENDEIGRSPANITIMEGQANIEYSDILKSNSFTVTEHKKSDTEKNSFLARLDDFKQIGTTHEIKWKETINSTAFRHGFRLKNEENEGYLFQLSAHQQQLRVYDNNGKLLSKYDLEIKKNTEYSFRARVDESYLNFSYSLNNGKNWITAINIENENPIDVSVLDFLEGFGYSYKTRTANISNIEFKNEFLSAPNNVTTTQLSDGRVQINWDSLKKK